MNSVIKDVLIPILVGVTGHRDIRCEDYEILQNHVTNIFREIQDKFPHTPITIISPLAEGADRLVAKTAVDMGISLIVPLPMPIEEYKKDFNSPASIDEFNKLLQRASSQFELPIATNSSLEGISSDQRIRNLQYSQLGAFLALNCQILIALWDGKQSDLEGGTGSVVQYKLTGIPNRFNKRNSYFHSGDNGIIYHILTPRTSNNANEKITIRKYYSRYNSNSDNSHHSKLEELNHSILDNFDKYNQDILLNSGFLQDSIPLSQKYLCTDKLNNLIKGDLKRLKYYYSAADSLANNFKKKRIVAFKILLANVVLAFFFLHLYLEFFRNPVVLIFYPGLLGIGALFYYRDKKKEYEKKHEDYRALSEALRVQFYWDTAGLHENTADYYLIKHQGELNWIQWAINNINLISRAHEKNESNVNYCNYTEIITSWIKDQHKYFSRTSHKVYKTLEKFENKSNLLFLSGIALSILLLIFDIWAPNASPEIMHLIHNSHPFIVLLVVMLLTISAIIHGYTEKMGFSEETKQYSRMAHLYSTADEHATKFLLKEDSANLKNLFFELGKESLIENADWLQLHRARPMEMPKGG